MVCDNIFHDNFTFGKEIISFVQTSDKTLRRCRIFHICETLWKIHFENCIKFMNGNFESNLNNGFTEIQITL